MAIKDAFIPELKHESTLTKKMLERVPFEKKDWRPHPKSMALGRLATHVAEIPHWISRIITIDDWDFVARGFSSHVANSTEELLKIFEEKIAAAIADLEKTSDKEFNKKWIVRRGDQMRNELVKKVAIRGWGFNHLVHHRGQLTVYLRLIDVPVPSIYGPTADEPMPGLSPRK